MVGKRRMRAAADQTRLDLLDRTLRYCDDDYDLANATYAAIDSKAQASFGVAGIFVAGAVALLNGVADASNVSAWIVGGVVACYVLLVGAIVCSLVALKVRETETPIRSPDVVRMTMDVLALPDEALTAETRAGWYQEQVHTWSTAIEDVEKTNKIKARWLRLAQLSLMLAVAVAGAATIALGLRGDDCSKEEGDRVEVHCEDRGRE